MIGTNRSRSGVVVETHRLQIRAVFRSIMTHLGSISGAVVHQMQLVSGVRVGVVTDFTAVRQNESLTGLLTNIHTITKFSVTDAGFKLYRIGKAFNTTTKSFVTTKNSIQRVVGIEFFGVAAFGGLGNVGQAVPRNAKPFL